MASSAFVEHGLDDALVARAYAVLKQFFALPTEAKRSCTSPAAAARGATRRLESRPPRTHTVADLKEFWHVGRDDRGRQRVGGELGAKRVAERARRLPRDALGPVRGPRQARQPDAARDRHDTSGSRREWFADKVDHGNSILRPIHYPPLDGPSGADGAVRSAAHGDINLITLLVGSGEPGLQILSRKGEWIPVSTIEGVVVCNVGDMLERLTNNALPSTIHRVVNPPEPWRSQPRYSIPFFLHPNSEFPIETLPECIFEATQITTPSRSRPTSSCSSACARSTWPDGPDGSRDTAARNPARRRRSGRQPVYARSQSVPRVVCRLGGPGDPRRRSHSRALGPGPAARRGDAAWLWWTLGRVGRSGRARPASRPGSGERMDQEISPRDRDASGADAENVEANRVEGTRPGTNPGTHPADPHCPFASSCTRLIGSWSTA